MKGILPPAASALSLLKARLDAEPNQAHHWLALADALIRVGRARDAEALLLHGVARLERSAAIWASLATVSIGMEKFDQGLFAADQAVLLQPSAGAKASFAACLKHIAITRHDPDLQSAIARALDDPHGSLTYIGAQALALLGLDPPLAACIERANRAWPRRLAAAELFGAGDLAALDSRRLLHALLDATPVCGIAWERFLAQARHALLGLALDGSESPSGIAFFSALARQCFINEYIYDQTIDEAARAEGLKDLLRSRIDARRPIGSLQLLALACYVPLQELPYADALEALAWPRALDSVLRQQFHEPRQERELAAALPCLTPLEDEVSRRVRNQYETNPYPRWVKAIRGAPPQPLNAVVRALFPQAEFKPLESNARTRILVAGAGTGQHPIATARRFSDADVLAIDLSRRSLGYAQRKALEADLGNIRFAQADILEAGRIGEQFDLIESVGVLHHMQDPWAGWRALLPLLKPNGLMRLGFYSRLGRRNISRLRRHIREQGYGSTPEEIRRCRESLVRFLESEDLGSILLLRDFYCTSGCRDLLFHVEEHQTSLHEIGRFMEDHGLSFLGFEADPALLATYRAGFPGDPAASRLEHWQAFEQEHPDAFVSMYQFWVQKR